MKIKLNIICVIFSGLLMIACLTASAQQVDQGNMAQVKTWLQNNWLVVTIVGLAILLIIMIPNRKTKRSSTTIIKDDEGKVKSVTTTRVEE